MRWTQYNKDFPTLKKNLPKVKPLFYASKVRKFEKGSSVGKFKKKKSLLFAIIWIILCKFVYGYHENISHEEDQIRLVHG